MKFELFYNDKEIMRKELTRMPSESFADPVYQKIRYWSDKIELVQENFNCLSLMIDQYHLELNKKYIISIRSIHACYVLISYYQGRADYSMQHIKESILIEEGHCVFFFVKPGIYQAAFTPGKHAFRVICFAHDVSILLANQFPILLQFIAKKKATLESFHTCLMDTKFRNELSKLHPNLLRQQTQQTKFILIQLSKLLSSFKGLIQGRDRFSAEKNLLQNILLTIESALKNNQSIRVSVLTRDFPITRRKLEKLFHDYLHLGPSSYIRKRKVERVQQMLISTDQSLLEISLNIGFSDVHSLNRTFKAYTGSTLSEFRKNNQPG